MTNTELLNLSNKRKNIAKQILLENSIFDILNSNKLVKVVGSYDLDLMYDCDIDILVEANDVKEISYEILKKFIETEFFSKVEYGNFLKFPKENRPKGYIVNLFTTFESEKWEIEIWFMKDVSESIKINESIKNKINDDKKIKILREKYFRDLRGQSKNDLSSFEIYKNILEI